MSKRTAYNLGLRTSRASSSTVSHHSHTAKLVGMLEWARRRWLLIFNLVWSFYVGLPWLAPVFMHVGWTTAGNGIYMMYATQCHQLPQRSFFLFGPKVSYSLQEIQAVWYDTNDPDILRQFIGNPQMGWKVAWSDRMVAMYTSMLLAGLVYWPLRRRLQPASLWSFGLLTLPLLIDGTTHMLSDFAGIGKEFRDSNLWLAWLTNSVLPSTFYAGDALGSFNSWMRLLTGSLFGIGVVWLVYPYLERLFNDRAQLRM